MTTDKPKLGGARPGSGRKAHDFENRRRSTSVALTPAQREKLKRLGGAEWVRRMIDEAE